MERANKKENPNTPLANTWRPRFLVARQVCGRSLHVGRDFLVIHIQKRQNSEVSRIKWASGCFAAHTNHALAMHAYCVQRDIKTHKNLCTQGWQIDKDGRKWWHYLQGEKQRRVLPTPGGEFVRGEVIRY